MPIKPAAYYIYYNINKKVWSVKYKKEVIEHFKSCYIPEGYTKVSDSGRDRVRREGRKNVHAYIVSSTMPTRYHSFTIADCKQVYYNPYNVDQFMVIDGEDFVLAENLKHVYFTPDRKVYCKQNITS